MKKLILSILMLFFVSCSTTFTKQVLNEKLQTIERGDISFGEILKKNKGKKTFVQVFASYCPVSQDSFHDVLELQKEYPDIHYVFLSVDHSFHDWKRGLKNIKPKGQFYYLSKKEEGELGKLLKLKTIPRFLVLDEYGKVLIFKSSSVSSKIKNRLKR